MLAFKRAFELLPAAPVGLRPNGFDDVHRLLQGSANVFLRGRALRPDTGNFYAFPSSDADSIRYLPFRATAEGVNAATLSRFAPRMPEALRSQREMFRDIAITWVARYPQSSTAYEALGLALQRLAEPTARDTVRKARRLASTPDDHLRADITSAIVEMHAAMPSDQQGFRRARLLADSALALGGNGVVEVSSLASLAALTGRVALAARLAARDPRFIDSGMSRAVWEVSQELLTYAALGIDTARTTGLMQRLDSLVADAPPEQRDGLRAQTIERAALILLPSMGSTIALRFPSMQDPLFVAARSLVGGDRAGALAKLREVEANRQVAPPSDWTFDLLVPEAWLRQQAGDGAGAAAMLDRALAAQNTSSSGLANQIRAAALIRAMALRATLAKELGDRATANRWATAVVTLLSGADDAAKPLVAEMKRLMS